MKDLKKYCKSWIDQNMCDGDDRSKAHGDVVRMSSPELYEMVDDMLEMYLEEKYGEYLYGKFGKNYVNSINLEDDTHLEDDAQFKEWLQNTEIITKT